ncbi:SHOCT domain-containing protein [Oceanobacillus massiliensis]|uniref:SHOCT domain-containing protein n=1 Tax=Oceanobacillus massiliensis TaxID=1465765 RepID=UPI000287CBA8|nr:SHOCT domain-containing protein [Oceanobacillus massiliensis]
MPVELIVRIVLSILLLIVLIIILSKFRATKSHARNKDSLTILDERLKRGEITEADYKEAKKRQGK